MQIREEIPEVLRRARDSYLCSVAEKKYKCTCHVCGQTPKYTKV
jgi:hypothetical protein